MEKKRRSVIFLSHMEIRGWKIKIIQVAVMVFTIYLMGHLRFQMPLGKEHCAPAVNG